MNVKLLINKLDDLHDAAGFLSQKEDLLAEEVMPERRLAPGPALLLMAAISILLWILIFHVLRIWL